MAGNGQPSMDVSTPSSSKSNKRSNHQWTPFLDKILVECLLELVNQGWKADNSFKNGYLGKLEEWMGERLPGCKIKGDPHIKSRHKTLKAQYREVKLMRSQSGFGWDDITKCVTCEDDVWSAWVKSHKEAAGLRNKPFPLYDELALVFGKDQAHGEGAESAFESVEILDKQHTTLEAAEAASKAYNTNKKTVTDDYFGVDVEVENINEAVFLSDNGCSESFDSATKKTREQIHHDSNVRHRNRKRKASPGESSDESINSHIIKLANVCDATRSEIGRVATEIGKVAKYFEHLSANVENKPLLFEIISTIDGLTADEAIQAYGIISADKGKSESFLSLPSEVARQRYVKGIIGGLI